MKKLLSAGFLLAMGMAAAMAASTINPSIPTPGSSLSSAPIRANFAAAYADVNALQARFPVSADDGGFGASIAAQSGVPLFASGVPTFTGTTGTGNFARAISPTFTGTLTMASGAVLNTPSNLVLTSATGLPISTGVTGLASGIASWLAAPSSANLLAAVTDETGTGALVFNNVPIFINPVLGAATGNSLALNTCVLGSHVFCATGTASISGATTIGGALTYGGVTLSNSVTGTGSMVLSASPTFTGTAAFGTLTASTPLAAASGGTGQSSYTIGDLLYASGTTALSKLTAGTATYVLTSNGAGVAPSWQASSSGVTQTTGTCASLPTLAGTVSFAVMSYSVQTCTYVKTGKTVTTTVNITAAYVSGSGSGFGYISNGVSDTAGTGGGSCAIGSFLDSSGFSGTTELLSFEVQPSSKDIWIWRSNFVAGTQVRISASNLGGTSMVIKYSCTYEIP